MERITLNLRLGKVKRVVENGRAYLVAPATTIVEGVLSGSRGSLFYPRGEIRDSVKSWDGCVITQGHPFDPVTNEALWATAPGVWERQGLGHLRNSRYNPDYSRGPALQHECWFDEQITKHKAPSIYNALMSGAPMSVSTGLGTHNVPHPSTHNGKPYQFIARAYQADHLAILPHEVGACSVDDGCGLNVNANPEGINQYSGGGTHSVNLPANPKKMNIGHAEAALKQMGHTLGMGESMAHEGKWITTYKITGPDGTTRTATASAIRDMVYAGYRKPQAGPTDSAKASDQITSAALAKVDQIHAAGQAAIQDKLKTKLADIDRRSAERKAANEARYKQRLAALNQGALQPPVLADPCPT